MSRWIHGSAAQAATWRAAFDAALALPRRGAPHERVGPTPGPGWTINAVEPPVDGPGNTGALEVPEEYQAHLGTRGLPAMAASVDLADLPPGLRTAARARKGLDENGNLLPFREAGEKPAPDRAPR